MKKYLNFLVTTGCFTLITFTVIHGVLPVKYDIQAGDTCPVDIYASRSVVDKITTEKQKNELEAEVPDQYDFDNSVTLRADRDLANIFIELAKAREGEPSEFENSYCAALSDAAFQNFRTVLTQTQQDILNKGVTDKEVSITEARELLRERLYDEAAAAAGAAILGETLAVNKEFSREKTDVEIQRVRDQVPNVTYKPNQVIVRKGDIITEAQFSVLSDLGLIRGRENTAVYKIIGSVLIVLVCFAVAVFYLKSTKTKLFESENIKMMTAIIAALTMLMLYLNTYDGINAYTIPIAAGCILIAVLTRWRFAVLFHSIIVALASVTVGGDAYYAISVLLAGYIGVFLFTHVEMRRNLVFSSMAFCAAEAAIFFIAKVLESGEITASLNFAIYGIASGLITSIIVMGTLPFWESAFDVITPFRLLELTNPNQPLLKRLLLEAPGTYHHSLMVGNLAEAACEAVGGSYLLARAGAYYHDVGKLIYPDMFVENQYTGNPHDNLSPLRSAKIILSHTSEGEKLAAEGRLPAAIRKIIASHHGTTFVAYFYHKAKEAEEGVDPSGFRYGGPKPQTKEEAVVMLADCVEAAVRSLDEKSEDAIRAKVQKIVDEKISDGQLKESLLTFSETEIIVNTFVKVFGGYFHQRVKYPEKEDKKNENSDNKQPKKDKIFKELQGSD